jgi:hypothetical protein
VAATAEPKFDDLPGQILHEFDRATIRRAVYDRVFGCTAPDESVFGFENDSPDTYQGCIWQQNADVSALVRQMLPLTHHAKDKVLSSLRNRFTFEAGIPADIQSPADIDDAQCGYCQPVNIQQSFVKGHLYDKDPYLYRVCVFFQGDVLRDVNAQAFYLQGLQQTTRARLEQEQMKGHLIQRPGQ